MKKSCLGYAALSSSIAKLILGLIKDLPEAASKLKHQPGYRLTHSYPPAPPAGVSPSKHTPDDTRLHHFTVSEHFVTFDSAALWSLSSISSTTSAVKAEHHVCTSVKLVRDEKHVSAN